MNVFCHINEFETPGFALLGSTLRFSRRLSLWSPSPWLMVQARSEGASVIGPSEMLTLVEQGHIVIMGRTDWLTDRASRNGSEWEGARWFPDYDDVVSRWASEDEFKTQKRVMLLGFSSDARGYTWADEQSGNEIWKRALERYRAEALPPVLLANARRLEDVSGVDVAVRRILRDARNHVDAFRASDGAAVPLEPAEHGDFAFDIVRERNEPNTKGFSASNAENAGAHLIDLLKFCATLRPPETSKELFESLHDPRREELISEVGRWADQPVPVAELHRKIQNSVSSENFFEQLRTGHGAVNFAAALAGLVVALLTDRYRRFVLHGKSTEQTRRNFLYLTLAALGLSAYGVGDTVVPKTVYTGPTFPFLLAYGSDHPNHTQIQEMLDRLEAYLQSN